MSKKLKMSLKPHTEYIYTSQRGVYSQKGCKLIHLHFVDILFSSHALYVQEYAEHSGHVQNIVRTKNVYAKTLDKQRQYE